jgi:hypothetical protein
MIGYAPHALDLEVTHAVSSVTPYATTDFKGVMQATVDAISGNFDNFIGGVWPYLLGVILLILFVTIAVRIASGSFRKLSGMGRRA